LRRDLEPARVPVSRGPEVPRPHEAALGRVMKRRALVPAACDLRHFAARAAAGRLAARAKKMSAMTSTQTSNQAAARPIAAFLKPLDFRPAPLTGSRLPITGESTHRSASSSPLSVSPLVTP
jgi:hypothetical protein